MPGAVDDTVQVRIVSDSGTFMDASVEVDGKPLAGVHKIELIIEAGAVNKAVLHVDFVNAAVDAPMRRETYLGE